MCVAQKWCKQLWNVSIRNIRYNVAGYYIILISGLVLENELNWTDIWVIWVGAFWVLWKLTVIVCLSPVFNPAIITLFKIHIFKDYVKFHVSQDIIFYLNYNKVFVQPKYPFCLTLRVIVNYININCAILLNCVTFEDGYNAVKISYHCSTSGK